jgi:oligosaccharide repeat unit polymerase
MSPRGAAVSVLSLSLGIASVLSGGMIGLASTLFAMYAVLVLVLRRFAYLDPIICFVFPWSIVVSFLAIDLTRYNRPITAATLALIGCCIAAWGWIGGIVARSMERKVNYEISYERKPRYFKILVIGYLLLTALNIYLARFIPLISLLTTGDSMYFHFGVPGLYGFYNAYANALGALAFYLWAKERNRIALMVFFFICGMFVLCVTRQNLISLLCEAVIIFSLVRHPFGLMRVAFVILAVLMIFSIIGELRSGDIRAIAQVKPEYEWVPQSVVWPYSYGYFNLLNLDNTVVNSKAPYFDGFSFATLMPSRWRPEFDHPAYLETSQFTVSSYLYSVYLDLGMAGAVIWTIFWGFVTAYAYNRARQQRSFFWVATYAVLFFCALFSFSINFWTYLPIIFQIPFFFIIERFVFRKKRRSIEVARS